MAFDFDNFVNRVCIGRRAAGGLKEGLFGRMAAYVPADTGRQPFAVPVDFHEAYEKVELEVGSVPITSTEVTAFLRLALMPVEYPAVLQGDFLEIEGRRWQIIDVKAFIPGVQKAVLHDAS